MVLRRRFLSRLFSLSLTILCLCAVSAPAFADSASFDLSGPTLEVKVTRGSRTLPITEVPNLAVGDKLWIRADFPADQAAHYLLVATFLRGSTNIPPDNWFYRCETWEKKCKALTITIPTGAQQMLLFLAPETGGDFKTLRGAIRGQPGAFVRASQDLNQAGLDRSRLDAYLQAVRRIDRTNPETLKTASPLLARSLDIKIDSSCLGKDIDEIGPCLTDKQNSLVLSDGHSTSIVAALTSGAAGDVMTQAGYAPQANSGYYSPYIASIMDIAKIMDSFHTAEYQYIPALAVQIGDGLALKLNTPPSFHNPKSVLVIALPAIEPAQPPPMHPVDESEVYCAQKPNLTLPVQGAPLVFSTNYAHGLVLHLEDTNGKTADLPLTADAMKGGLTIDSRPMAVTAVGANVKATIRGEWGFDPFTGPAIHLQGSHEQKWMVGESDKNSLVVGRDDKLHLFGGDASCVSGVELRDAEGRALKATWKQVKANQVEVNLPLKNVDPGAMALLVSQEGLAKPESVAVHAFAEAGRLDSFTLHAGDHQGMLAGTRLDEVASLSMKGIEFKPGTLSSKQGMDDLPMEAVNPEAASALKSDQTIPAVATLRDGRTVKVTATVDAARPSVTLIDKSIESVEGDGQDPAAGTNIQLADPNELPQNATILFSLKAQTPARFLRGEKIEVATDDGSYSTELTLASGLTLQDAHTALATLDPAKAFGSSAFGPLQFRVVTEDGVKGDWQPLATLVRLPHFQALDCSGPADATCKLRGDGLFLVDSIAQNQQFVNPVHVPDGFPGRVLPVPHPDEGGQLYVKLRDDPTVVNMVTLTPLIAGKEKRSTKQIAARESEKPRPDYPATENSSAPAAGSAATAPGSAATAPGSAATAPGSAATPSSAAGPASTTAPDGQAGSASAGANNTASQPAKAAGAAPSQPSAPSGAAPPAGSATTAKPPAATSSGATSQKTDPPPQPQF